MPQGYALSPWIGVGKDHSEMRTLLALAQIKPAATDPQPTELGEGS
jgi:hypothetical protein